MRFISDYTIIYMEKLRKLDYLSVIIHLSVLNQNCFFNCFIFLIDYFFKISIMTNSEGAEVLTGYAHPATPEVTIAEVSLSISTYP